MSSSGAERRRCTRKRVWLLADYDSKAMELTGSVTCISRSGLFMSSDFLDELGSMVALDLQLPNETEPVHLAGRVVRVETSSTSSGMGIQFTDLSWRCRLSITRFVEEGHSRSLS
tara:strand:- start:5901 stop:6245 length:345 start_codon:yes stop_codon:yes gene_type:complete